ncbi:MAG: hypothetical protein WCO48_01865 [Candidatus Taylorbacteria bacterium]
MKKSLTFTAIAIGALLGASALSVLAQSSGWSAPTATPPGNNVAAPLNVSTAPQAKSGLLGLSNLLFNPTWSAGSVTPGSVLTALDSDGTVGWGAAAVSSGGGGGASIDYGNCTTIAYTEGGACSGSVAQGMCPTNFVMVGNTTGLRFPGGACVSAQMTCCKLRSSGGSSGGTYRTAAANTSQTCATRCGGQSKCVGADISPSESYLLTCNWQNAAYSSVCICNQ